MSPAGVLDCVAYRLSRHRFLRVPLDIVLVVLCLGLVGYSVVQAVLSGRWPLPPAVPGVLVGLVAASLTLRARSFVLFRPSGVGVAPGAGLPPFEKVPVRASGFFEVGGDRRYFVEAAGFIEATGLGERVLMVRVERVSLVGMFSSPAEEWGWWYAFFRPEDLSSLVAGQMHFGWRPRPALRLDLAARHRQAIFLSFADAATRDRVAGDLALGLLAQK